MRGNWFSPLAEDIIAHIEMGYACGMSKGELRADLVALLDAAEDAPERRGRPRIHNTSRRPRWIPADVAEDALNLDRETWIARYAPGVPRKAALLRHDRAREKAELHTVTRK